MGDGMMGWDMGFWMIVNLMFWALVFAGVVLLIVWAVQRAVGSGSRAEESALDILKKRYARGEISKQEYEEKKQDLV